MAKRWTALVPLAEPAARKTRLAEVLGVGARVRLSEDMRDHVLGVLDASPRIRASVMLGAGAPGRQNLADAGRGLNAELSAARVHLRQPLLILFADLPLLGLDDIHALLHAAEAAGIAMARDRHRTGTNAVAIATDQPFDLCFGPDSAARHMAQTTPVVTLDDRTGLSVDIDTPADLSFARALGFELA